MRFNLSKKWPAFLFFGAVSFFLFEMFSAHAETKPLMYAPLKNAAAIEGQIIIKYKENKLDLKKDSGKKKADEFEKKKALEKIDEVKNENLRLFRTKKNVTAQLAELNADPNVEFAEPNYLKSPSAVSANDTLFSQQWGLSKIKAPEAWDLESAEDEDVIVAVIDTGVFYAHEDLAGNMWDGSVLCRDDSGNVIPSGCPNHGWDFKDDDNDPNDESWINGGIQIGGHGTMVAGVIGAVSNNSKGISGVSRYQNLKIMAVRFGMDTISEVKAINFAKHNGAKVINASFGGEGLSLSEKSAIAGFDGIFVAAAGNGGDDLIGDNNDLSPMYPCSHDNANLICVTSTSSNDALSTFSNYGPVSVDIAAPGEGIISAFTDSDSSYASANGTSMATPFVAGIAGMLYSQDGSLTIAEIRETIISFGDLLPDAAEQAKISSGKRVNLFSSLQSLQPQEEEIIADEEEQAEIPDSDPAPDPNQAIEEAMAADFELYKKYLQYQDYEKYALYQKYKKAKKKYGFKDSAERLQHKEAYNNFKLFKKNPIIYAHHAASIKEYKKYANYKKHYSPVKKYSKYKKYDKSSYKDGKQYGTAEYKAGYDRYRNY